MWCLWCLWCSSTRPTSELGEVLGREHGRVAKAFCHGAAREIGGEKEQKEQKGEQIGQEIGKSREICQNRYPRSSREACVRLSQPRKPKTKDTNDFKDSKDNRNSDAGIKQVPWDAQDIADIAGVGNDFGDFGDFGDDLDLLDPAFDDVTLSASLPQEHFQSSMCQKSLQAMQAMQAPPMEKDLTSEDIGKLASFLDETAQSEAMLDDIDALYSQLFNCLQSN